MAPRIHTAAALAAAAAFLPALACAAILCEKTSESISCDGPGTAIRVDSAVYGRTSSPQPRCGRSDPDSLATTDCADTGSVLTELRRTCNGETECLVTANNNAFDDPCPGIVKYLNYTFECVSEEGQEGVSLTASACEKTEVSLFCPGGLVVDILSSNYGRTSTSDTCGREADELTDTSCFDFDSIIVVQDACQGQPDCALQVSNTVFGGDPCPNTVKVLEIEYQCVASAPEPVSRGSPAVCEDGVVELTCPPGEFIEIQDATFGRNSLVPDCDRPLASISNTECGRIGNMRERLQLLCQGLPSCEIPVTADDLGINDPCPGTVKYLEVESSCSVDAVRPTDPGSTTEPTSTEEPAETAEPVNPPSSEVESSSTCEALEASASCLPGTFINVLSATFGRRGIDPDCMRGTLLDPDCGRDDNVLDQVTALCENTASCDLDVAIETFEIGDPCPGTVKALYLDYSCDGTPPDTPPEGPDGDDQICEGTDTAMIACSPGETIQVTDATFGRSSLEPSCGRRIDQINNTECGRVNNLRDSFVELCDGKPSCEFEVSVDALNLDPCPGFSKYLDIQYTCGEGDGTPPSLTDSESSCEGILRVDLLDVFENFGMFGVALNLFVEDLADGQAAGSVIEIDFPRYCSRLPPPQGEEWNAEYTDISPYNIVAETEVSGAGFGFAMVGTETGPCYPTAATVNGMDVCSIDSPPVVAPATLAPDQTAEPTLAPEACRATLIAGFTPDGGAIEFNVKGLVGGTPAGTEISFELGPGCQKQAFEWNADFTVNDGLVTATTQLDNAGFGFAVDIIDEDSCFPSLPTINGNEDCSIMRPSLEPTEAPTTAAPLPTAAPGERGSLEEEVCVDSRLALTCFGDAVLRIVSAVVSPLTTCGSTADPTVSCPESSAQMLSALSALCNGEPFCFAPDVGELLDETCGQSAGVEVTYDCLMINPPPPEKTEGPEETDAPTSEPDSTDAPGVTTDPEATDAPPASTADVLVCEREEVTLDCGSGTIEIDSAFYGRLRKVPDCGKDEVSLEDTSCSLDSAVDAVRQRCDGRVSCTFDVTNNFFGEDPCSTTFKYTEIEYSCNAAAIEGGLTTLCESETLELDCGLQPIVVTSAFFGRNSKTPDCGKQAISLQDTDCSSTSASAIVVAECTGVSSCSIDVDVDALGGDPCPGTSKYLSVDYECGGDGGGIPSEGSLEVCERNPLLITCGSDVINIKSATFGRGPSSDTCGFSPASLTDKNCNAPEIEDVLIEACDLQSTCSLDVGVDLVNGDPCPGTVKVLEVDWECVPAVDNRGCPLPVTVTTCEREEFEADCPTGKVIEMKSVSYGRSDATTCSRGPASVTDTSCEFDAALSIVSDLCDGDKSCSFPADLETFAPDPCVGTVKYLTAEYVCVDAAAGLPAGC